MLFITFKLCIDLKTIGTKLQGNWFINKLAQILHPCTTFVKIYMNDVSLSSVVGNSQNLDVLLAIKMAVKNVYFFLNPKNNSPRS